MFFLCEIILFSGLMDREKDQKMGADVNTTPQPCNGPLIYVFPHSPHSVKFVLSFHWAHARIAPNSGQLMQGIQITEKIKIKCNKKEVEFPRTFLSFPHCFFGWVNNPKKIVHYPTRYYSTTRLLSSLPYLTLSYPKLKNHYPSGPEPNRRYKGCRTSPDRSRSWVRFPGKKKKGKARALRVFACAV